MIDVCAGSAQGDIADFGAATTLLTNLESLDLSMTLLTGNLTGFCGAATQLKYLDLSFTYVDGSIPSCLLGTGNF